VKVIDSAVFRPIIRTNILSLSFLFSCSQPQELGKAYVSKFADLGLGEEVLRAVSDAGYETPTPIQEKAIPFVLMNRDVLGCAQTGTGKTASFTLPMIDILAHGRARARMPRTIILEPTRELAAQVADNFDTYGKYHKLSMALLIGGVSFNEQEKKLDRGVDVLIATPGRLIDHCERGKVILKDAKIIVIDEADRMLDMGFIPDVEKILTLTSPMRQTVMFSATMPKEIRKLADKFLSNPKEITVDAPSSTADTVEQGIICVDGRKKRQVLNNWLKDDSIENGLIFCNRKRDVAALYKSLEQHGVSVGALHGDMDQYKRMECLSSFKNNEIKILVCSDVSSTFFYIAAVGHVFNYDVPMNAEDYVHRIGRTGRAGRSGKAYTIATKHDEKNVLAIEKLIGKKIPLLEVSLKPERKEKVETANKPANEDTTIEVADKKPQENRNSPKQQPPKSDKRRGGRSKQRGYFADEIGEVDDIKGPFGESDMVPAFLRQGSKNS